MYRSDASEDPKENNSARSAIKETPQAQRANLSFHLLIRLDSRRIAIRGENDLSNPGGISPRDREYFPTNGASQSRDGSSDALDLVLMYSNHHTAGQRAATPQNRLTRISPSSDEEDTLINAASVALLSMEITHVRGFPSHRCAARCAVRTVAESPHK